MRIESVEGWQVWHVPMKADNESQELKSRLPLAWLANADILQDQEGRLKALQASLLARDPEKLAQYRHWWQEAAQESLAAIYASSPVLSLTQARDVAMRFLWPMLTTEGADWYADPLWYPHAWRLWSLGRPRAVTRLDTLYGFGGEEEARRVLSAARGMGLASAERRAREALRLGYADGAVRFLRDETARLYRVDLEHWSHLSSARREKLTVLLGLERCPLGGAALSLVAELAEEC